MIYIYIYIMCLSVCLYPPNVKASKRSGPKCLIIWPQRRFMNAQNYTKEMSSCHKLYFFNLCIYATRSRRHLLFQTINSVWSNNISLKYYRFTSSGCKNIGIRKFEFVAKNHFLCLYKFLIFVKFWIFWKSIIKSWNIRMPSLVYILTELYQIYWNYWTIM